MEDTDTDFFALLGDNFYDKTGDVTARMFDALAYIHRVQSRSARAESTATQIKSSM